MSGQVSDIISVDQFFSVDIRLGRIKEVLPFPEAHKPAYKLVIDFGPDIGVKKSSARITDLYKPEDLLGRQVSAVVNLPPRQIGPFVSEVLVLGYADTEGRVVLLSTAHDAPDGARLH